MKKLLLCMLILVNTGFLNAQQDTAKSAMQNGNSVKSSSTDSLPRKKILYKIQLQEMSGKNSKGYLTNITDEEVIYVAENAMFGSSGNNVRRIGYSDVAQIKLQRKASAGRGALIGLGVGAGLGVLVGFASGDDKPSGTWDFFRFTAGEKAQALGLFGGITGALVGLLVGAASKQTFIIGGKKEKHKEMKFDVLQKIYGSRPVDKTIFSQ